MTDNTDKTPLWANRAALFILCFLFILAGGAMLYLVPGPLAEHWSTGASDAGGEGSRATPSTAAQVVVLALGGVVGTIGVALSLSRHGEELKAAKRDKERLIDDREREQSRRSDFDNQLSAEREREENRRREAELQRLFDANTERRSRFVTLLSLLADSENPTNRIAALHALGALADDWAHAERTDEVQVCINVITEYLRTPPRNDGNSNPPEEIPVRKAGFSVIGAHLKKFAKTSWSNYTFTLSGAIIDYRVDLSFSAVNSSIDLSGVIVRDAGSINFLGSTFNGHARVNFLSASIEARRALHFDHIEMNNHAQIDFTLAQIEGREGVSFEKFSMRDSASISFTLTEVRNEGAVSLTEGDIRDHSSLDFRFSRLSNSGMVDLSGLAATDDSTVDLTETRIFDAGIVSGTAFHISTKGVQIKGGEMSQGGAGGNFRFPADR